ncbi:type VI secretion system baseplate subunit TssE [Pseudomonas sp. PSKL.D1]|uniref:type VI secretion system baseplate subunit TssE n=1 Tax=Pseudomonas sp. PSKL.D1 TaxID=3029060 RepID=UPI002380E59F|nr:type VI secretion system baseplate subunit TssE [Pseudomonas sp. PSKL.D1]WDY59988.1 type VI secretion system baseplate subunit TssE [Pseudomonas sp. PSKL.D1]
MSGLFERMASQATVNRALSSYENPGHQFEVIKRHLEILLNTRQGCSQSSPELGLRDFNSHDQGNEDLLRQVSADIRHTLQHFEPRITLRALKALPDAHSPQALHFRLDCQVQVNSHAEQLQIELLVNGHNRYTRVR